MLTDHNNLTYEIIESTYQSVQIWKSLTQGFGVTLIYINGEANVVSDAFSHIPMVHHDHKLADANMEENTCDILCLDSLFIYDNTYCFSLDIYDISFPLAPQIVEAEQKLELQTESSTHTDQSGSPVV